MGHSPSGGRQTERESESKSAFKGEADANFSKLR